jgi:hypothetical protein
MQLRTIQALALAELLMAGGLFCAARVGAGKTLISGLAPTVLNSRRPLLVVPAALVEKTHREFAALRVHWKIPYPRIISYTQLGLRKHADALAQYAPDLIIFDEAQHLKHVKSAACARRVARFLAAPENREVRVVVLTGTPARKSLKDYAHLLVWALRDRAPVPHDPDLIAEWAALLDDEHNSDTWQSLDYSILVPHLGHVHDRDSARLAFQDRLKHTPGVVISADAFTGSALTLAPIWLDAPGYLDEHWERLRELWTMPDGWLLADKAIGVWQSAQQLALGFYYRAEPRPPDDWNDARKEWCRFCRRVLEASEVYDTEAQVRDACVAGKLPSHAWDAWESIRPSFELHTVAEWLSVHALEAAAAWGRDGGIVWTNHRAFGTALSKHTGWAYFGSGGLDATGRAVDAVKDRTIIASIKACGTGRNLQYQFNRNLFVTPPTAALDWEQFLGRTHRDGQPCAEVAAAYFIGCLENLVAVPVALGYARYTEATLGQPQKLLQAELTEPNLERAIGPAYGRLAQ